MFVRFVILRADEDSHQPQGIFQAAYELRDSDHLALHESELLKADLAWFVENLHVPDCLEEDGTQRAISWFKPQAHESIKRVRSIAVLLKEHGWHVRMLTTDDPGKVIFEDDDQVVAYPRRHRRNRSPSHSKTRRERK